MPGSGPTSPYSSPENPFPSPFLLGDGKRPGSARQLGAKQRSKGAGGMWARLGERCNLCRGHQTLLAASCSSHQLVLIFFNHLCPEFRSIAPKSWSWSWWLSVKAQLGVSGVPRAWGGGLIPSCLTLTPFPLVPMASRLSGTPAPSRRSQLPQTRSVRVASVASPRHPPLPHEPTLPMASSTPPDRDSPNPELLQARPQTVPAHCETNLL